MSISGMGDGANPVSDLRCETALTLVGEPLRARVSRDPAQVPAKTHGTPKQTRQLSVVPRPVDRAAVAAIFRASY